ncbi:MAG: hypothetical protein QM764_16710 [Chitinophagaceae bacterium]
MNRIGIIQELSDLKSNLPDIPAVEFYVPAGYFEGFADSMLNRVKALEAANTQEELAYLSPLLDGLSKQPVYAEPEGYFEDLSEAILAKLKSHEEYQTAEEELADLSPLLSSIGKKNPYSVPQGYFENFQKDINLNLENKPAAKVISITNRKWFRFAAAAVVIGFIALTSLPFIINSDSTVPVSNSHAWIEENMKKVSTDDINNFIQPAVAGATAKAADVGDLLKDISDKDIQNFLNETNSAEDNSDDVLLN